MKILAIEKEVAGLTDEAFKPHLKAEAGAAGSEARHSG